MTDDGLKPPSNAEDDALWSRLVRGELSVDEVRELEARAAADPDFARRFPAFRPLGDAERAALVSALGKHADAPTIVAARRKPRFGRLYALSALVSALAVFVLVRTAKPRAGELPSYALTSDDDGAGDAAACAVSLERTGPYVLRARPRRPLEGISVHASAFTRTFRDGTAKSDVYGLDADVDVRPDGSVVVTGDRARLDGADLVHVVVSLGLTSDGARAVLDDGTESPAKSVRVLKCGVARIGPR